MSSDLFGSVPTDPVPTVDPSHFSIAQQQADAASRTQAQAAAAGGNARSLHRLTTHGVGNSTTPTKVQFSVTFVEEPMVTSGMVMRQNAVDMGALPLASVSIYRFVTDARGLYVGAYLLVAVGLAKDVSTYEALNATTRGYVLEHHICFEGLAIRDVSYDAIMDDG